MKPRKLLPLLLALLFTACAPAPAAETDAPSIPETAAPAARSDTAHIRLSDTGITLDGVPLETDPGSGIYTANDIVYYESGKDFTYGEGTEADAHTAEEAAAHTVLHIARPGTYRISGTLSAGQIAVDLGEDAKEDPTAVVTLILDGADITCRVAPAVIFYNVYECGSDDAGQATKDVDTRAAGANVVIADGSVNTVRGAYVARIYEPGTLVLSQDGTEVEDAKKLHKYDGAFYSRMSMNMNGGPENTGILNIYAENEGLDSELHLTLNGGNISIVSGNDGINTNEDGVSVTTVNGGSLTIRVTGETGEGDGIDSNGWLVINGGSVTAAACSFSADAGIDSDMGIHINGGTVIATGHMLDRIEAGTQNYAVFHFARQTSGEALTLKDQAGQAVFSVTPENACSVLIYAGPDLAPGTYTLWMDEKQLAGQTGAMMRGPGNSPEGMEPPEGMDFPEGMEPPEGMDFPEGMEPPEGSPPSGEFRPDEGFAPPEGFAPGKDGTPPQMPQGDRPGQPGAMDPGADLSPDFLIPEGGCMFSGVTLWEA